MRWLHRKCLQKDMDRVEQLDALKQQVGDLVSTCKSLQVANSELISRLEASQSNYQRLAEASLNARFTPQLGPDLFAEDPERKPEDMVLLGPKLGDEERVSG